MHGKGFSLRLAVTLLAGVSAFAVTGALGSEMGHEAFQLHAPGASAPGDLAGRPPLYDGLGSMAMAVTTASGEARDYFNQGLRLAWGFNHAEAQRAFREAQRLDRECAMCFWGEAFALGPNINDGMHEEAIAPAWAAIRRAMALRDGATAKERALIEALAERYAEEPSADRSALDRAWAEAVGRAAESYPDDVNILVLHAEALMNLQPWDYWEGDRTTPKGNTGEIVAALERALTLEPGHPAAAHFYIHAVEASATPERAEAAADAMRGAMPAAGHLTHMPAHLYIRIGRHRDSIEVNRDAVAADEAFLAEAGDAASKLYRYGYYPHNVHFLMVSAQMAGLARDVLSASEKLARVLSEEVSQDLAWVQAIQTSPFSAHAQFSDAATILALPDPGERFPFVQGFRHYARGLALVREGRLDDAAAETVAIAKLIETADLAGLEAQYLPARDVLGLAQRIVEARIVEARGDAADAERLLREAIALEDSIPYMEPPYWYYPVRQTLGAVLLAQGRAAEAVDLFEQSLVQMPRNGWALWGLVQAKRIARQDSSAAEAAFAQNWLGEPMLLDLERL